MWRDAARIVGLLPSAPLCGGARVVDQPEGVTAKRYDASPEARASIMDCVTIVPKVYTFWGLLLVPRIMV